MSQSRKLRPPYPPLRPYPGDYLRPGPLGSQLNIRLCGLYLVEVGKIYFSREAARVFSALGRHWFIQVPIPLAKTRASAL